MLLLAALISVAPGDVVQSKKYALGHEVALSVGAMPADPFQKGWAAGLSYTAHLSDSLGWEVVNAQIAYLTSTALRHELIGRFERSVSEFAAPRALLMTGLVITPLYGKQALPSGALLHQSLFAGLYGGVAFGDRPGVMEVLRDVRPLLGAGIGYRVFADEVVSFRLDARYLPSVRIFDALRTVDHVVLITMAMALSSGVDE